MEPNREKGTENVAMLGVTLRMTMTSAGFHGISLDDMLSLSASEELDAGVLGCVRAGAAGSELLELKCLRDVREELWPGRTLGIEDGRFGVSIVVE